MRHPQRSQRSAITIAIVAVLLVPTAAGAARFAGAIRGGDAPLEGAMVTFRHGEPAHEITVYSGPDGSYRTPELDAAGPYTLRVRRIGWRDLERPNLRPGSASLDLALERETDPLSLAAQLPANRWWALVLEKVDDPVQREELVRQCTYCHQQGNWATRMLRPKEQWEKVLQLMARMGAGLSSELREQIPEIFNAAYELETAVPRLTRAMHEPDFAPPPDAAVRTAVVEEWALGHRASMQHDLVVHPDGRIYSVDMMQDKLYRLDPRVPGGKRESFDLPRGDLPLGGVFGGGGSNPSPPNANAHVGPHSLQVDSQGGIWITLALGNQIARFDPDTEEWTILPLDEGYYPHTLRIDQRGRIWYTVAASNHVGVHDPATGEHQWIRLPAPTWGQAVAMRMLPLFIWLNNTFDLSDAVAAGEGIQAPVPYGIDIAPDGTVWISQLNAHRLGRIDPDSFEVEMIDTPFTGPRRLRFDSQGNLWIPGFSSNLLARFDPETREFKTYPLPIEPLGTETPYALNVDQRTDTVWICGTNSDTLIRFEPATERFTVYPLPTRVTYTREIDFDADGGVWASNSNMPTWQIEGAIPKVLRLDPEGVQLSDRVARLPEAKGN